MQTLTTPGDRIAVVGACGSGKTTLARRLSALAGIPHVELDALHWGPDWTPTPTEELRRKVSAALAGDKWVTDGNYSTLRDIVWGQAETLVWLDYPLPFALARLMLRTCRRVITRELLWNGNRETLRDHILTSEPIFAFSIRSHRKHRQLYPELLARPEFAHLTLVHLRHPSGTDRWLSAVAQRMSWQPPAV